MSSYGDGEYRFVCPGCDECLEVNASMKEALIDSGCIICGTAVTTDAFTSLTSTGSR